MTSAVLDLSGEHTHSALLLDLCHSDLKSIKSKAMTIPQQPVEEEVNFVDTGPASLGPGGCGAAPCTHTHFFFWSPCPEERRAGPRQ